MDKKIPLIVCIFNGRNDNLGDRLIFHHLLQELKPFGEVIILDSTSTFSDAERLRLRTILLKALFARLKGRKVFLFDPPGALAPALGKIAPKSVKGYLIYGIWRLARALRVRVGISVHPKMEISQFRRYKFIGVRDNLSIDTLRRLSNLNVKYCPDLAFLAQLNKVSDSCNPNKALISFRALTPDNNFNTIHKEQLKSMVHLLLNALNNIGIQIEFYSQVNEDYEFNKKLSESTIVNENVGFRTTPPDFHSFHKYYEGISYVISNRLHVLLVAAASGCLPIALVDKQHYKVLDLFKSVGWHELIIELNDNMDIQSKLYNIINQRDTLRSKVVDTFDNNSKLIRSCVRKIFASGNNQ